MDPQIDEFHFELIKQVFDWKFALVVPRQKLRLHCLAARSASVWHFLILNVAHAYSWQYIWKYIIYDLLWSNSWYFIFRFHSHLLCCSHHTIIILQSSVAIWISIFPYFLCVLSYAYLCKVNGIKELEEKLLFILQSLSKLNLS